MPKQRVQRLLQTRINSTLEQVATKLPNAPLFPSPACTLLLLVAGSKKLTIKQVRVYSRLGFGWATWFESR
jgi:hypothetical protein